MGLLCDRLIPVRSVCRYRVASVYRPQDNAKVQYKTYRSEPEMFHGVASGACFSSIRSATA